MSASIADDLDGVTDRPDTLLAAESGFPPENTVACADVVASMG